MVDDFWSEGDLIDFYLDQRSDYNFDEKISHMWFDNDEFDEFDDEFDDELDNDLEV